MFINRRSVTIEWGDCDPAGIVFYPRYFAMFDASTAALFSAALGMDKFTLRRHYGAVGFPMLETAAKFTLPSRYAETVAAVMRKVHLADVVPAPHTTTHPPKHKKP